jgi:uncharacterized protein (TIGR03437 family)
MPAVGALLLNPAGMALDSAGNLYVVDSNTSLVRKVSPSGIITTVAGLESNGLGVSGYSGDGGPATQAMLNYPNGLAVDSAGNLYIADTLNQRVRKVTPNGTIATIAGNGTLNGAGDGGPATQASLINPNSLAIDTAGNLYISQTYYVRKVTPGGTISTVAGNFLSIASLSSGDGGPATSTFVSPYGVAVDSAGNIYFSDTWMKNAVRKVSPSGIITTVAGGTAGSFQGDGGPATAAGLYQPGGVAVDSAGNLYIADTGDNRVRLVSGGIISTIAGTGALQTSGDGGPATSAALCNPTGILVGPGGVIYVSDQSSIYTPNGGADGRVRKLAPGSGASAPTVATGGVVPVYSSISTIQAGEWISIYGTNLASATATWNGNFPTSLGGTSVMVDGKPAYLWFVSPTQINLQAPDDTNTGTVPVVVTTSAGSVTASVTLAQFAPSFSLLDSTHVAGIILRSNGSGAYGGGAYDILGPTGSSLGYSTVAARAGDTVALFAVGLGPTTPMVPSGQSYSGAAATTHSVSLTINGKVVTPAFAGLTGAGLYQINLTVPAGLGSGDVPLLLSVAGAQTPAGVVISLQ